MKQDNKPDFEDLRKRAEEELRKNPGESGLELSEADKLKLIHELEVYKVELEMQQDELKAAKERIENINQKYNELFDLHNRFILHLLKKDKKEE
jgi:hypothetical protein